MNFLELDATVDIAIRDIQTVTSDGKSKSQEIDGVLTHTPINHVDHRGRVFEIYTGTSGYWHEPVVYCYTFTVRPNQIKGWGLHEEKDDRYTLISGELLTVLYDARVNSPTHTLIQKVYLTPQGTRQLLIPKGVWHCNIALGTEEAYLINHPTKVYKHEHPDRLLLPWDTKDIPIDLSNFLPK